MKLKPIPIIAAVFLILVGSAVTYLLMSIPNDVKAESILRQARDQLKKGNRAEARESLRDLVEKYPRTDAAAAGVRMLFHTLEEDRRTLDSQIRKLQDQNKADQKRIAALEERVTQTSALTQKAAQEAEAAKKLAAARPSPTPRPVVRKATPKKKTPTRKTTKRRR